MKLYVVMMVDRHVDPDCEVFVKKEDALARAREFIEQIAHHPEILEPPQDPPPGDWLFYQRYGEEDDRVWVVEKEVEAGHMWLNAFSCVPNPPRDEFALDVGRSLVRNLVNDGQTDTGVWRRYVIELVAS